MTILEQTYREEIDALLKRIGGEYRHKKHRSQYIAELLMIECEKWDEVLELLLSVAIEAEEDRKGLHSVPLEHVEQCEVIRWFNKKFDNGSAIIYAIPNGGHRDIKTAVSLRDEGVMPGVADLKIEFESGEDIYLEMKRIKGSTHGEHQVVFQKWQENRGKKYILAFGAEDAKNKIIEWLKEV